MVEHIKLACPAGDFDALTAGPTDGRGVLLLHGFPEGSLQWTEQLTTLGRAGHCAVAPDQRGYSPGARPENVEDYRMENLVGDVLDIADRLGWARFDLVGHDWGAAVAWSTAAAVPDRVRTLSALSVPHPVAFGQAVTHDADQRQRSAYMNMFRSEGAEDALLDDGARRLRAMFEGKIPAEHIEHYVARLSEPAALTAALNWYRAVRFSGSVGTVPMPTLYIWSTADLAVGTTAAHSCGDHVTGEYRFEILEGLSHWLSEEAPGRVGELLLEHLRAHPN